MEIIIINYQAYCTECIGYSFELHIELCDISTVDCFVLYRTFHWCDCRLVTVVMDPSHWNNYFDGAVQLSFTSMLCLSYWEVDINPDDII